ncbi:MAG: hypothetical protein EGQ81_03040 [Akkermansia sp.]|nr:hypothetical protein [Akkermansia sp.]
MIEYGSPIGMEASLESWGRRLHDCGIAGMGLPFYFLISFFCQALLCGQPTPVSLGKGAFRQGYCSI